MAKWQVQYANADMDCDGYYPLAPVIVEGDYEHEDDVINAADELIVWPEGVKNIDFIGCWLIPEPSDSGGERAPTT